LPREKLASEPEGRAAKASADDLVGGDWTHADIAAPKESERSP
jgi:hypothetical protein